MLGPKVKNTTVPLRRECVRKSEIVQTRKKCFWEARSSHVHTAQIIVAELHWWENMVTHRSEKFWLWRHRTTVRTSFPLYKPKWNVTLQLTLSCARAHISALPYGLFLDRLFAYTHSSQPAFLWREVAWPTAGQLRCRKTKGNFEDSSKAKSVSSIRWRSYWWQIAGESTRKGTSKRVSVFSLRVFERKDRVVWQGHINHAGAVFAVYVAVY